MNIIANDALAQVLYISSYKVFYRFIDVWAVYMQCVCSFATLFIHQFEEEEQKPQNFLSDNHIVTLADVIDQFHNCLSQ